MEKTTSRPLHIFVIPFLGRSHLFPLFDMARLLASRGQNVTVFASTTTAPLLQTTLDKDTSAHSHRNLSLLVLPLPTDKVGLPSGVDFSTPGIDTHTSMKLYEALSLLQPDLERFIETTRPDCIFSDKFYPWTPDVAARIGIPRIVFHAYSSFAQSFLEAMSKPDSPHWTVESDDDPFVVPGLPDAVTMTRSRLPGYIRSKTGLLEMWREGDRKSYGAVVNSFYEMESAYSECHKKLSGLKIFHIGPAALVHRKAASETNLNPNPVPEHECLMKWLDTKEPGSVLYVSFGSYCIFPDEQLVEIACGLEASGCPFIWVVHGREKNNQKEDRDREEEWLPSGFKERLIEKDGNNRGMIVRGWAPQVTILEHESVGGFLTHCGWSSVNESVWAGVPMITWPLYAEQFFNEKLVSQVARIGVEVGAAEWSMWVDVGKKVVVGRERIKKAVRRLMTIEEDGDGDREAEMIRRNVRELSEKAKGAVEVGGSSYRNLTLLIEELMQMRDVKGTIAAAAVVVPSGGSPCESQTYV